MFIYPDELVADGLLELPQHAAVGWFHRNDQRRADYFRDAMVEQGLGSLIGSGGEGGGSDRAWNPLLNRTFGAVLAGASNAGEGAQPPLFSPVAPVRFVKRNPTTIGTVGASSLPAELVVVPPNAART